MDSIQIGGFLFCPSSPVLSSPRLEDGSSITGYGGKVEPLPRVRMQA